jgi:hypothetical protein
MRASESGNSDSQPMAAKFVDADVEESLPSERSYASQTRMTAASLSADGDNFLIL